MIIRPEWAPPFWIFAWLDPGAFYGWHTFPCLEAQKRFQDALAYSDDPEVHKIFQELARVRRMLSPFTFGGSGKQDIDTYREKIDQLKAEKDRLEAGLSRLSTAFSRQKKFERADSRKIAKMLPQNTVLLEFAQIRYFNFKAQDKEDPWLPAHYLVFVVHAGEDLPVGLIDLGEAEPIDKAIADFKISLDADNVRSDLSGKRVAVASEKLYQLVFVKLKIELGETREIFVSPDGNLNLIPFEVLKDPNGRYLIEDYTFNYLAAGRDIVGFGQLKGDVGPPLLIGNPNFDLRSDQLDKTQKEYGKKPEGKSLTTQRSMEMRGRFGRIPSTEIEVETIKKLLKNPDTGFYTWDQAIEDVVLRTESPRIQHLATHGFFLSD